MHLSLRIHVRNTGLPVTRRRHLLPWLGATWAVLLALECGLESPSADSTDAGLERPSTPPELENVGIVVRDAAHSDARPAPERPDATPVVSGGVRLLWGGWGTSFDAFAWFRSGPPLDVSDLVVTEIGPCRVARGMVHSNLAAEIHHSVGDVISITGDGGAVIAKFDKVDYPLPPGSAPAPGADSGWDYSPDGHEGRVPGGGETLLLTAPGGTLPGFQAVAVAPDPLDLQTPTPPPCEASSPPACTKKITLRRTADFPLTWSGGPHGDVLVTLGIDPGDGGVGVSLECSFPMAARSGVIPAAALEALPSGAWGRMGVVASGSWTSERIAVDGGSFVFQLRSGPRWKGTSHTVYLLVTLD